MITFPNAKINIGLNIVQKRNDGFHDIETILYPICVQDALELKSSPKQSFQTWGNTIPGDDVDNICLKAYQLLKKDFDLPQLEIHLLKQIPIGAGLGGGSSDAAFFIKLVNHYFKLNLSNETMENYCRQLGSDCAFFVRNEPVFAYGRGDQFKPIQLDLKNYKLVIIKPEIHIATASAYADVKPQRPVEAIETLIEMPPTEWKDRLKNDFEQSAFTAYPELHAIKMKLYQVGAVYASMSGSGSALFGLFDRKAFLPSSKDFPNTRMFWC